MDFEFLRRATEDLRELELPKVSKSEIYNKGFALAEAGNYTQALGFIQQYLKEVPNDGQAWNNAGVIFHGLGQSQKATECFRTALNLPCNHGQVYLNIAKIYLGNGQADRVVELFEKMHHNGVLNKEMVLGTVNSFIQRGDNSSAIEAVLKARKYCQGQEELEPVLATIRSRRAKIAFFCGGDGPTFLKDILEFTKQRFGVRYFSGTTRQEMYDLMKWSDISWFEWCTEITVKASQMPKVCKNIVRLHRYEAYLDYPKNVNWNNIDTLITVGNKYVHEYLCKQVPDIKSMTPIVSVPNGVDMEKIRFVDRKRGENLAFVGNMRMVKNPMFALQCMRRLHEIDKDFKLFFAGEFPVEDAFVEQYLKHMVDTLGLGEVVFFDGWQKDIDSWFADKHYIISTSVIESQGMGILEGMAMGLKPVVHNFPGAEGTFTSEFLFNTAEDFCEQIMSTEYNPGKYRLFVEDRYSLEDKLMRINGIITGFERDLDLSVKDGNRNMYAAENLGNPQSGSELLKC